MRKPLRPEFVGVYRYDDGRSGCDGLAIDIDGRKNFGCARYQGLEIDRALAERNPLHRYSIGMLVNHRVAQMEGYRQGTELLHSGERIFGDEHWIASIQIGADKLFSSGLNNLARLPGLQILV